MLDALQEKLRRHSGPMTEELRLGPSWNDTGLLPFRSRVTSTRRSVCGFCSTGCSLTVHLNEAGPVNLTPTPKYPVNLGTACPKGWEALTPLQGKDRGTTPLLRNNRGDLEPVSWATAADRFCREFKRIQREHGPDSLAWIGTGQITTEELALLGAVGRFGMGIRHGDGNTRQCMATAASAYKESFGFDAPPYTYADFEESDLIVLVGSNLAIAHPILWYRILRNLKKPRIVIIDPRRTETAQGATHHYAIAPKSDLVFFYGIARVLIEKGWIDKNYVEARTTGFDGFAEFVGQFTLARVAAATGVPSKDIVRLAEWIHQSEAASFWWTMGVNQGHEAVRTAQSIINICLMTGQIGRPGTGPNSITGQCNAMGSRLYSNTASLLGGRDFRDANHRADVAGIVGISERVIPRTFGWAYDEIIEQAGKGTIKGLWIIATNPAHSWMDRASLKKLLSKLEFLVVQDMYHSSDTAQLADLYLPAAAWGEKTGTFINSERRFGLIRKMAQPPGEAMTDFNIVRLLAEAWGCGAAFREWSSPETVFQILKKLSAGSPCDITGIPDYETLESRGGVQWPCVGEDQLSTRERRLFADGKFYHADGRAKFCFEAPRAPRQAVDGEYPFALLTGRGTSAQWHTQTRTGMSAILRQLHPKDVYIEIHPDDASALELKQGDWAEVTSARGSARARVTPTHAVARGQIFMPMHYPETNQVTMPEFDPYSRQPSYKMTAVRIGPVAKAIS